MDGTHSLIGERNYTTLACILKKLGHPSRLKILDFIRDSEASVTQIQKHSGLSQAMTSQHLKLLYESGLVSKRRKGTVIYYRTKRDFSNRVMTAVADFKNSQRSKI